MSVDYPNYPEIRGVQPTLMYDWKREAQEIVDFPDVPTYTSRAIYEFEDPEVTVTILPWVSQESKQEWKDESFDPSTFTKPEGWKIMVTDPRKKLGSGGKGNTVYDTPKEAVEAVKQAARSDLEDLRDALDEVK